MTLTETEGGIHDVSKSCQATIRHRAEEGVGPSKPEAWVHQAFPDLLPFPVLDSSAIMPGVVANDASTCHGLLFSTEPPHFRWSAEQEETQNAR